MVEVYLLLFLFICLGLLGWGLIRSDRIYQYPFYMGGIFTAFIFPQAIALYRNPGPVSPQALERVLLMSCLCSAMCWLGYQLPANKSFLKACDMAVDLKKLLYGGIFFTVVSYVALFLIFRQPEEVRSVSKWTGIITIYAFFTKVSFHLNTSACIELLFDGFEIIEWRSFKQGYNY